MSSCITERDRMIEAHAYLVEATARRMIPPHRGVAFREDAEGEGYLALVKAADSYDPARGPFRTWAIRFIRLAMQMYLREQTFVPNHARKKGEVEPVQVSFDDLMAEDGDRRGDFIPDPAPGPEAEALENLAPSPTEGSAYAVAPFLWIYLEMLPRSWRTAAWNFAREEPETAVAAVLGCTRSNIYFQRQRAFQRLREMMTADGWAP